MHDEPHAMQRQRRETEQMITPRMLQRLVDGELPPEEYRQVLAALEEHPGAWRDCALTFLEAQALQWDLGKLVERTLSGASAEAVPQLSNGGGSTASAPLPERDERAMQRATRSAGAATRHGSAWAAGGHWLSLAACVLLALAAGLWSPWRPEPRPGERAMDSPGVPQVTASSPGITAGKSPGPAWGTVQLVADAEASHQQRVPVYELSAAEDTATVQRWLAEGSALAGELEDLLRRGGFEVQREQHLLAAPLEDGRHAIVPVEGYYLQPARWTY